MSYMRPRKKSGGSGEERKEGGASKGRGPKETNAKENWMREKRRWSSEEDKGVCPGTVKTDRQTQSYLVQQAKSWSQATEMNRSGFGQACCWEKKTTDPEKARGAHLVESVFAQKYSGSLPRGGLHCFQPVAFHLQLPMPCA